LKTIEAVKIAGILIALVVAINGCSHQPVTETQTRKEMLHKLQDYLGRIPEPDRRERLLALLDDLAEGLAQLNRVVDQFGAEVKQLNRDYDAARADFHQLLAKFNASRQSVQQRLLTIHFEIKSLTTEKEWADIAKMEREAVEIFLRQNLLDTFAQPQT
jgi:predicted  nucleic acid-binding Zn-ribbon protein